MRVLLIGIVVLAFAPQARAACGTVDLGTGTVAAVRDDLSLVLADGRAVRLAGIEPTDTARPLVATKAEGRTVRLLGVGDGAPDRYGRLAAFVSVEGTGLQESLVGHGAARVSARAGGIACASALHRVEEAARRGGRGLWADLNFAPLMAESGTWMRTELGRFVLVQGKVLSVRQSGGTIYVNFGRRWTRDFTAAIPRRLQGAFRAAGRDPQSFNGRNIRVRGWLERRAGPVIEVTAPEQFELLE